MKRNHIIIIFFLAAALYACSKDVVADAFAGFTRPEGFPEPAYHFASNPVTKEGFELGRKLFYDPILSADNTISCGSCHIQTSAFTHHGHIVSHGIADRMGTRNSPPIMNMAWNRSFMWDGGIFDLDLQAIAPITNHVEMDETMDNVLKKIKASPSYPQLFSKAYGDPEINGAKFLKALSQFMLMCVSSNSHYDSVMRKQAVFTSTESKGYILFAAKCGSCHKEPLFTDNSFRNNGLVPSLVNDEGRYLVTQKNEDRYRFKVPSLRNLAFTAPYMHDGRFLTLDAVLDHYSNGIQASATLDASLGAGISLTTDERSAILAFLNTLNDHVFVTNKLLSEQ
ncbi:cytochrome-c peroxidase [Sediminibacterium roseum]|uniref:Cytochrome-c peroxidase n=1 Tax=Sediminibacterium roseum TaxID=1978412 RepID=A0ABX0A3L2_9BACT|nr:cytochrome c peroxidase [Sediminibacterium roseum]NCI52013.1 cytochrome-c peroxidase [Sediminibacterium roseum]